VHILVSIEYSVNQRIFFFTVVPAQQILYIKSLYVHPQN